MNDIFESYAIKAYKASEKMPYSGDISPSDAWGILVNHPNSVMIDVRTQPEWVFVGVPNLAAIGKDILCLSWKIFPTYETNPHFIKQISEAVPDKDAPLIFLCKVGGRSLDAANAMADAGYKLCFNIANGFEGSPNDAGQRGIINGWKAEGMPWMQN